MVRIGDDSSVRLWPNARRASGPDVLPRNRARASRQERVLQHVRSMALRSRIQPTNTNCHACSLHSVPVSFVLIRCSTGLIRVRPSVFLADARFPVGRLDRHRSSPRADIASRALPASIFNVCAIACIFLHSYIRAWTTGAMRRGNECLNRDVSFSSCPPPRL